LADQAADHIRRRIIDGDLRLGQALSESDLAGQLGVSKTPVREAFLRLKLEGLVDIQPQRGTFVFSMHPSEIEKLVSVRTMLEMSALQSAMRRDAAGLGAALAEITVGMKAAVMAQDDEKYRVLDGAFHRLIIQFSDNSFLASCYDSIDFRVRALRNRLADRPGLNARTLSEHRAIAGLVTTRRVGKAKASLSKHLGAATSDYDQLLRDHAAKLQ
jgi:DNA-binding GntR family transcriptional regulator